MSEGSPKGRSDRTPSEKSGRPKASKKSEVGSPKSEGEHSAPDNYREDTPQSELKELPTENSKPDSYREQTKNMEVHHHPQLEHKPKPWKEYLLEYFMIFLAVMTGFFAESYREHLSERSKEHEYAVNIKKDLMRDTVNLNVWIPALYNRVAKFDTLMSYLETNGPVNDGANMYLLARLSTRNAIYEPSDNTVLEMKSSGSLRLIHNHQIVNGLMNIERTVEQYRNLVDIEAKEDVMSYALLGQLFDAVVFDKMTNVQRNRILSEKEYARQSINILAKPIGNPQLLSRDKEKINQLIYYLHQRKSSFLGEARHLMGMKKQDEELLKQINDEYKLNDE